MSRLDSMIRRLTAHRAAIDWAAETLGAAAPAVPGDILECGLGNGRTYDHLRERFPNRAIWVIERSPSPHPDCWPSAELLLKGEAEAGFDRLEADGRTMALVNYDLGTGDKAFTVAEAERLAPRLRDLLAPGGVLLSVQPLPALPDLQPIDAAETGGGERIVAFRRT